MKVVLSLIIGGLITWNVDAEMFPHRYLYVKDILTVVGIFTISSMAVFINLHKKS